MFLKGAWQLVVSDEDTSWIDSLLQNVPSGSSDPFADAAHSIRAMLDAGVSKSVIARLVRAVQSEFLSDLCYMMDDPGSIEGNDECVDWSLIENDDDGNPGRIINGLHESVIETDPTGRECEPKTNRRITKRWTEAGIIERNSRDRLRPFIPLKHLRVDRRLGQLERYLTGWTTWTLHGRLTS